MNRRSSVFPKFSFLSATLGLVFIILVAFISFAAGRLTAPKNTQYVDSRQNGPAIKANQTLHKSFDFSVKDQNGHEVTKIKYTLQSADLQDQIIIRGQQASAIKGKTFLIINFTITNSSNKYIQLNSRDYVRLQGDDATEIAPDIHNDPIQIQPISTKDSRLGFPVDDNTKKFILSVGEIDGKKTTIPLSF